MSSANITWPEVATVGILAAQLIVLVAAAAVAWYQAREARRLRLEQHRPFVVIDVDFIGTSELFLYVKNLGTSLARSVKFEIDPPLSSAVDIPVDKFKMLTHGVSTLAPGKELRSFFDIGFQRNESDLPLVYTARVTYSDDTGRRLFDESMDLDIGQYMHLHFADRQDIHDVHKRLEEIRDVFRKWTWAGGSGVLTISRMEADEKNAERLAELERERSEDDP